MQGSTSTTAADRVLRYFGLPGQPRVFVIAGVLLFVAVALALRVIGLAPWAAGVVTAFAFGLVAGVIGHSANGATRRK